MKNLDRIPPAVFAAAEQRNPTLLDVLIDELDGSERMSHAMTVTMLNVIDKEIDERQRSHGDIDPSLLRQFKAKRDKAIANQECMLAKDALETYREFVVYLRNVHGRTPSSPEPTAIVDPGGFLQQGARHAHPDDELWKVSPAMALARDYLSGNVENQPQTLSQPKLEAGVSVPGEIQAAVETCRPSLLLPLRHQIKEESRIFDVTLVEGLIALLRDFYLSNIEGPVALDLHAALDLDEQDVQINGASSDLTLSVFEKIYTLVDSMDERFKGMTDGEVPCDAIRDGLTRAVAFYKIP